MPELPEVETVCRVMRGVLVGPTLAEAEVAADDIVFKGLHPDALKETLIGAKVDRVGRQGKYWWWELDRGILVFGHLGMAGWVRDVTPERKDVCQTRLREHGKLDWDDSEGRPRFLKLMVTTTLGGRIALTDGRRLARVWLASTVEEGVAHLGPDVLDSPRNPADLHKLLSGRTAPIKALLLDQKMFAGVGNWIADEVLFQAQIKPTRQAGQLTLPEIDRLLARLRGILEVAIEVEANSSLYPDDWLFNRRWGGNKGLTDFNGHPIVRETVGGRTTAWVPDLQF
ncbi:MAG: Fpg/Nei family DNA glycosylase [Chthonomonadaceae bacterium]|nr:Fpg/Nei family DNA glycosylase [Chthonomonadaceae bacterium]